VVAAADTDAACLSATAKRFAIPRRHADYRALLQDADVDVVAVCVPPRLHAEVALAALAAGKHVFIEKPLAATVAECDQLVHAAAQSPRKAMVGFNLRSHRLIRRAKEMIRDGAIGELELIRTAFTSGERLRLGMPGEKTRERVGVLADLGVHHFDLWRYLTGHDVKDISATIQSANGGDESATVTASMENGLTVGSVFSHQTSETNELEIFGRTGSLRVSCYRFDGLEFIPALHSAGGLRDLPLKLFATLKEIPGAAARLSHGGDFLSTYEVQWRHFAESIRADAPVECTVEDGRRAVQISLAATTSSSEARRVRIAETH
jgi:predicted dehydrogenase